MKWEAKWHFFLIIQNLPGHICYSLSIGDKRYTMGQGYFQFQEFSLQRIFGHQSKKNCKNTTSRSPSGTIIQI